VSVNVRSLELRAALTYLTAIAALFVGTTSHAVTTPCGPLLIDPWFETSPTVVLVRVTESTFSLDMARNFYNDPTATLRVERFWKGRFFVGDFIRVAMNKKLCIGICQPYPFQIGEEVLVFAHQADDPIDTTPCGVVGGRDLKEVMDALDDLRTRISVGEP
jgi:hypothetical protein